MTLTPDEVRAQVFTLARQGYDEREVDTFLDSVVASLDKLGTDVVELRNELNRRGSYGGPMEASLAGVSHSAAQLLVVAQATADDCVAAGQTEATTIIHRARQEAAEIRLTARMSAAELMDQTETERRESLGRLLYEQQRLQEAISAAMVSREQVRTDLEDYLRDLLGRIAGPGADGTTVTNMRALRA